MAQKGCNMKNIKGVAVGTDGNLKRMAITYDVIRDDGVIEKSNVKANKIIVEKTTLNAVKELEDYAQAVIDAIEE